MIVDAVYQNLEIAERKVDVFNKLDLEKGDIFSLLLTDRRMLILGIG